MAIPGREVVPVPSWIRIIRGVQLLFAVVIFGLSCNGVHWLAFNCWSFSIFVSLFTFIVVGYELVCSNVASAHGLYNALAIILSNALLVVFWLSAMGSLAATRAIFVIPAVVNNCYNTGGIGGGVCDKRSLLPRYDGYGYFASDGYLITMVVAAILAAAEFVLFALCTVIYILHWNRQRVAAINTHPNTNDKVEAHQMAPQQQYNQAPQQQYNAAPHQQQQTYPQQQFVPASTQPYVQQTQ